MGDNLNGIFANMIQGMGFIGCAPNRVYNMAPPDGGGVEATAEGTDLLLHSAAAPLTALTLYGKSEQETTTGAQLFDANKMVYNGAFAKTVINDITNARTAVIPIDPGVEYSISRGNLEGNYFRFVQTSFNGDITKLSDITPDTFIDGTYFDYSSFSERTIIANSSAKYLLIYLWSNASEYTLEDILSVLMVNADTTALPWEPYTGGAPSPSPDYPQEIKSVGDSGAINVTLSDGGSQSQTLPVQTPNGLPGIPVSSGGNYTDANGQQWICDEVDFKRGVYVQRIHVINAKNRSWNDGWNLVFPDETGKTHVFNVSTGEYAISQRAMSNVFFNRDIANPANVNVFTTVQGNGGIGVRVYSQLASTLEEWNAYINSHDVIFALALKEQNYVETPLSASELAAYAALRTYSPTTVVTNDAGAWMKMGYKATPQPMTMMARKR